jgi:hypothetical protein
MQIHYYFKFHYFVRFSCKLNQFHFIDNIPLVERKEQQLDFLIDIVTFEVLQWSSDDGHELNRIPLFESKDCMSKSVVEHHHHHSLTFQLCSFETK